MRRKLNVLEAQEFRGIGTTFYCTSEEIQSLENDDAVKEWLGNPHKITLDCGREFEVLDVSPMTSFTGKVAVMLKLSSNDIPSGIYPTSAVVS